jgi:hypothetical protein
MKGFGSCLIRNAKKTKKILENKFSNHSCFSLTLWLALKWQRYFVKRCFYLKCSKLDAGQRRRSEWNIVVPHYIQKTFLLINELSKRYVENFVHKRHILKWNELVGKF